MKKQSFYVILVGIVVILTLFWFNSKKSGEAQGLNVYPALSQVKDFDLKQVKGQYFILHFWAKWCEPCTEEIPHLVEFAKTAQFKKPLLVLAVSLDPSLEESKEILPNHGAGLPTNFILALDSDRTLAERLGSYQYPESYFVDPNGQIIEKWIGTQKWQRPEVLEFFKQKVL